MDVFERKVRVKLKGLTPDDKVYLKKNYAYEIFTKHHLSDDDINGLFDPKGIIRISPNVAFPETRIDAEINVAKNKALKIIFLFDPVIQGKKLEGKIGIITAFYF